MKDSKLIVEGRKKKEKENEVPNKGYSIAKAQTWHTMWHVKETRRKNNPVWLERRVNYEELEWGEGSDGADTGSIC